MSDLRPELPDAPDRILALPRYRGYPVPAFVAWLKDGKLADPGTEGAVAEFRVTRPGAAYDAHRFSSCWVCGQRLGAYKAFLIGPMCAVNRNTAEPPCHVECAEWSAVACPFLSRPHAHRRDAALPDGLQEPPGIALSRNPGVALVWVTRKYRVRAFDPATGGMLFDVGDPERVAWYSEGRAATRAEIEASITSGLPALEEIAAEQGSAALAALGRFVDRARVLLPA